MTTEPSQPLTDAELAEIRERVQYDAALFAHPLHLRPPQLDRASLLAEVDRLRSALAALGRNERAATGHSLAMQEENERLREENERLNLEVVQNATGAQVVMDAGAAYLQEVKRLEKACAGLKEINDHMGEERLRVEAQREAVLKMHKVEDYLINTIGVPSTRHRGCFTCKSDGPCATRQAIAW